MVLHRERVARVDVKNLTNVRVGTRPDGLVTPRLWDVCDLDRTGHRGEIGEQGVESTLHAKRNAPDALRRSNLSSRLDRAYSLLWDAAMILEPKYLPKLAATVGLFTR